jgi:predicted dinucleotide-binding enzyme
MFGDDSHPAEFSVSWPPPELSITERIARDCPNAKIVKAFNTLPSVVLQRLASTLAPHRVSVFLCGDDHQARETVKAVAEILGLVGIDCGGLERARLVEAAADSSVC